MNLLGPAGLPLALAALFAALAIAYAVGQWRPEPEDIRRCDGLGGST